MKLGGFQKLTLLDFPGHMACTVFTEGCNFRCPFCHNAPLVVPEKSTFAAEQPDEEAFFAFLRKRQGILEGVAITGGEPLLHADLKEFIRRIRDLGYAVKLDTNGMFPDRLRELIAENLVDYVAMDIKNAPARYAETAGLRQLDLSPIFESVELLLSGAVDYEFRTTVVRGLHDAQSFEGIGKWISGAKRYFLQQFKDSGDLLSEGLSACSREEMLAFRDIAAKYVPNAALRGVTE